MEIQKINKIFLGLLVCVLLASCSGNRIYHDYAHISNNGWQQDAPAVFSVPVDDTIAVYNVIIDIRNRNEYPYQNLYLFARLTTPDGKTVGDTLNCILTDNQGRWLGKGIGSTSSLSVMYMPAVKFSKAGVYEFSIQHGMREDVLEGINDIGLRVEKRK
ncbi:gliding motility lipoprotein GldH [Bacteroidia bacterium]|nr:gliding motility lipoprotein GldH [Bacteroidia bacterium]